MSTHFFGKTAAFFLALALFGCSTGVILEPASSSRIAAATEMAPARERPGLATTFGETHASRVTKGEFERSALGRPWLLASVFYNDDAGAEAAGAYGYARSRNYLFALNHLVEFGVRDPAGNYFPVATRYHFFGQPEYHVIGKTGERYELVIKNNSDTRLEVVASVDGLDVLDGKPAAVSKRGYLAEPGKAIVIEGWRTSLATVAAFRFGSVQNSYAEKKYGDSRNVGVIGLAIFNPAGSHPRPYLERENRRRKKADPFPNSGGFAEPPAN